jgi:hypothetical protein
VVTITAAAAGRSVQICGQYTRAFQVVITLCDGDRVSWVTD